MKYSYNWLKELSGTEKTVEEVSELFLTHSFEVEGIEDLAKGLSGVVVGEVLNVEKHPDADRLNVAVVNVGESNNKKLIDENNKFEQTEKVLTALKKIKKEADKEGLKFWVLGGLACAFHVGKVYREHDDLDLIAKNEEDRQKLIKLIQKIGFSKIRTKKLTNELSVDIYKNVVEVEVVIGEYVGEFGLVEHDFSSEERELMGVKALILSRRFIESIKEYQIQNRDSMKDGLDLRYLSSEGELQIVCGAPNLKKGQKVPVALVGAKLMATNKNGEEQEFVIKQGEIRGVESNGMICAEDELGLGDNHEGIMILDAAAQIGQVFAEYMSLDDKVLDIDILPNRGHDCLGYSGIALELNALESSNFRSENLLVDEKNNILKEENFNKINVKIETENCSRYTGIKIDGVKIKPSPQWMQAQLRASGIGPINNIVDITNYVMLETGQPLHAFDAFSINQISIRQASENEKIKLLDEQEVELCIDDILITDGENPIALAGVMGGRESGIQNSTTEIILEGANFNSTPIRFTARKYGLQTDAAYRFERDIDPNFVDIAMTRAVELIKELADGNVVAMTDIYPEPIKVWNINLKLERVRKLLGVDISNEEVRTILERLKVVINESDDALECFIPTRRRDLRTQEDLIEEIGRIYGYEKIKPRAIKAAVQSPRENKQRLLERQFKSIATQNGFSEVRGYSFYSQADADALGFGNVKHISLLNPASPEQAIMRNTLVSSLLRAGRRSLSYFQDVRVIEVGKIYKNREGSLPQEESYFGGAVVTKGSEGEQFYELKGLIDNLLESFGISDYYYDNEISEKEDAEIVEMHPSRRALLKNNKGEIIGWLGEITKKATKYFGLKNIRAAVCEINVDKFRSEIDGNIAFEPLPKFPFMERDLSMIVSSKLHVGEVEGALFEAGKPLIRDVDLFDLYQNKETGEKSMAFHLVFGDKEKTLQTGEVDDKIANIIKTVEADLDVDIRR